MDDADNTRVFTISAKLVRLSGVMAVVSDVSMVDGSGDPTTTMRGGHVVGAAHAFARYLTAVDPGLAGVTMGELAAGAEQIQTGNETGAVN